MVGSSSIRGTATEAKARLLALVDDAASGEEIEITKHGRVAARLIPARGPHALRGLMVGKASSGEDDESVFTTGEPWESG